MALLLGAIQSNDLLILIAGNNMLGNRWLVEWDFVERFVMELVVRKM